MVKPASVFSANCSLNLAPVSKTNFVCQAQKKNVRLSRKELGLLGCKHHVHFLVWIFVLVHLISDNGRSSHVEVYICLSAVDFCFDFLSVVKKINLFKEDSSILSNFLDCFGILHVLADILVVVSGIEFECLDEFLEVTPVPVWKTFGLNELFLDLHLRSEFLEISTLNVPTKL